MNVFLCWSGARSERVARALHGWLHRVIQTAEPWMSIDIDKGARWTPEIWNHLEHSPVGIICLTRENLESRWLHFEAGILARSQKTTRVCTFLLPDLNKAEVPWPLAEFQHTTTTKREVRDLVGSINTALGFTGNVQVKESVLDESFERLWSELDRKLRRIAAAGPEGRIGKEFGEIADQISTQLGKAGLDAPTVAGGMVGLSEAPLEVQLSVRRLLGELKGGFEQLSKAQRAIVYGGGPKTLVEIGRALAAEHRWEDSASFLDEYTEVNPSDWRAQKWRGIAHAMSRKGQAADFAALDAYKHAIEFLPPRADRDTKALLYNYRAAMFKRLGRYNEAERDLRKALKLAREELLKHDIHYNLACIFAMTGQRSMALFHVRKLRRAPREQKLIRQHLSDYFRSLASDREFLQLIAAGSNPPRKQRKKPRI